MPYKYPITSPAGVEIGTYTDEDPNLTREQVLQKFQAQQQAGMRVTGGQPGAPAMQQPPTTALQRAGGYLQEHIAQPIKDVAQMASEDIKSTLIPGYKKQPDPETGLGSLAAVGGTALFPAASIGALVGGLTGATSGVPGAQTAGELIGGGVGGAKQLKSMIKGLVQNKEQQIEKFVGGYLQTPEPLKGQVTSIFKGIGRVFKDQPVTFSEQLDGPLAKDAKLLLDAAKESKTLLPTNDIRKTVTDALINEKGKKELMSEGALKAFQGAEHNISYGKASYGKLDEIVHDLNAKAKDIEATDSAGAFRIREVANGIVDELDKVSPVARAGNALFRQDKMAVKIIQGLRKGNIKEVEAELIGDPKIAEKFGWNTPEIRDAVVAQLKKVKATPTQGALLVTLQRLGGSGLLAYALHRGIFDFVFSGHGR